ncbi:hypothetical protein M5X00_26260 [Paenibacillus alvei]|uniref:hypothetical protein n=1 Tax=Paenibacillus alvei TaxID=44250 RepID=UPI0022813C4A|nr:hypothetical protein [Paenibacillus alvei]MCY9757736.1 hypothetical protein [Paenibacillus alvei]
MSGYMNEVIQEEMEKWFDGYSPKRVSNHLNRVNIGTTSSLRSYRSFLGFKYAKEFDVVDVEIPFTESLLFTRSSFGRVVAKYDIECAIDETKKVVYWKAYRTEE